jgi:hypothetical protein
MTGGGITYITAVNNESQYNSHVVRSLCPLGPDDEFIPVYDKTDAGEAYNEGIAKAKNRFKCFLHQDVIVIDPVLLRNHILGVCGSPGVGMFGIMGSTDRLSCPWWVNQGAMVGSVIHSKGLIQGGPGGSCALLDGLLLATGEEVEFSEEYGTDAGEGPEEPLRVGREKAGGAQLSQRVRPEFVGFDEDLLPEMGCSLARAIRER